MNRVGISRVIIRRMKRGGDLLEELAAVCVREKITLAEISGLGALSRASLGVFLPREKRYRANVLSGELEICGLTGNVSLKENKPFVHAHLTLSDRKGRAFGGHLLPGCTVFSAEVFFRVLAGAKLERLPDPDAGGLWLWPLTPAGRRGRRGGPS